MLHERATKSEERGLNAYDQFKTLPHFLRPLKSLSPIALLMRCETDNGLPVSKRSRRSRRMLVNVGGVIERWDLDRDIPL